MTLAWFVSTDGVISGPFDTETLRERVLSGSVPPHSYVWRKTQHQWMALSAWQAHVDELKHKNTSSGQTSIWYISKDGAQRGPLTEREVLETLATYPSIAGTKLWASHLSHWVSVFEMPEILDRLGVNRREHDRAPLMGRVILSRSNEDPKSYILQASSISPGGMGIIGYQDFRAGDRVWIIFKTHDIESPHPVRATIAYTAKHTHAGLKFDLDAVPADVQTQIANYIAKFCDDSGSAAA